MTHYTLHSRDIAPHKSETSYTLYNRYTPHYTIQNYTTSYTLYNRYHTLHNTKLHNKLHIIQQIPHTTHYKTTQQATHYTTDTPHTTQYKTTQQATHYTTNTTHYTIQNYTLHILLKTLHTHTLLHTPVTQKHTKNSFKNLKSIREMSVLGFNTAG